MKNLLVIFILTISFNNLYSQAISYRYMTPKKGHAQQLHNDTRITGCKYPLVIHAMYMLDDFTKNTRCVSNLKSWKKLKNEPFSSCIFVIDIS